MKFPKIVFLLILVCFPLSGQQFPVWENNAFLYNRYTIGRDFQTVVAPIQKNEDGSIITNPYNYIQETFRIGNYGYNLMYPNINSPYLSTVKAGKKELVFFSNKLFLKKENQLTPVIFNRKRHQAITYPVVKGDEVFFSVCDNENTDKESRLYRYSGGRFQMIGVMNKRTIFKQIGKKIYVLESTEGNRKIKMYELVNNTLIYLKEIPVGHNFLFISVNDFYYTTLSESNKWELHHVAGSKDSIVIKDIKELSYESPFAISVKKGNTTEILDWNNRLKKIAQTTLPEKSYHNVYSKETASIYLGTGNHLMRIFTHIKKYPRLFNKTNSESVFALHQNADGKIWAGSYNGGLTAIDGDKTEESNIRNYAFMNGGLRIGNKMILNVETQKGILMFDNLHHYTKINDTATAFISFVSKDEVLYSGTFRYGIIYKPVKNLTDKNVKWKTVGKNEGITLFNCLALAEDRFGNIWTGRSGEGIAVFQPRKGKGKTWTIEKKEIGFGSMCILKDSRETLWFGGSDGKLYYYAGKSENDLSPENFQKIEHPLLQTGKKAITFLHQWKDWLVIGANDKVLLFDLKTWHRNKKVFVRYLNPVEASFTSYTEQNTVLTDFRDRTLWFATSDMVYQWDIQNWLKLPVYKVIPKIEISTGKKSYLQNVNSVTKLPPRENSLTLNITYQTPDNMPRYLSARLVSEDHKGSFEELSVNTHFSFQNLSSGSYVFEVLVCQQGGSFEVYKYPVVIRKFLWQNWWFWALLSLIPLFVIYNYFRIRRKIEQQKKEIAQLNLISLGKQFRPHFMLNALNSLGSDLRGMPHAERIISRIGENINIMHRFAKENHFDISFEYEWKLTLNTIDIQREIFVKELEVKSGNSGIIPKDYRLPMGILQINVENALLHGIRHRKTPPYLLEILFSETEEYYIVTITDNGVGTEKSKEYYDRIKNGTGLSNLHSIIRIINSKVSGAFSLTSENAENDAEYTGTKVTVMMKKNIDYEKFKT